MPIDPQLQPLAPMDDLINLIYEGPFEPLPWKRFLGALRTRAKSSFAAIIVRGSRPGSNPLVVLDGAGGLSIRMQPAAFDHARLSPSDSLARVLEKPGDIFTLDEVIPWDHDKTTDFYNSIVQPYGIRHQLCMSVADPCGWKCIVGVMNAEGMPSFGAREKEFLLSCLPHLRAALEIYARMQREHGMKMALSETLDQLDIGTFILDGAGKVITSNRFGESLVRAGKCISVVDSKIRFARKSENDRLGALIRKARESGQSKHEEGWIEALSVDCVDHALGVLVRTLPITARCGSNLDPRIALYVSDSNQQRLIPEHLISSLFGLTATEAKLANLLSNGLSLAEVAKLLNVRVNTARTYSKRIFLKVGVNRQSQLVRLILNSSMALT
ncbi:helix-turn-helix transcriptional regulator [Phenylobacterium sp.]|jgi:DNA-binding CsgD family transcriptional regulator|uniref:helix-turn-helix transcriptional regulator n=1 Tax=Phenylobacterium sp. TaxID=1871053 RepID=UPI002F42D436